MSEAPSNVVAPSSSSGAWKAQDKRQGTSPGDGADYASAASLAQAAAELAALANAGGLGATKGAAANLAGFANRDRGTSSRAFAGRGSAVEALGTPSDPTSRAVQQMKSGSSRHDPQARLEGKVQSDSSAAPSSKDGASSGPIAAGRDSGSSATRTSDAGSAKVIANTGTSGDPGAGSSAGNTGSNAAGAANAAVHAAQAGAGASAESTPKASSTASGTTKVGGVAAAGGAKGATAGATHSGQSNGRGAQGGAGGSSTSTGTNLKQGGTASVRGFDVTLQKAKQVKPGQTPTTDAQEKPVEAQATRGLAALLRQKGGNVTLRLAPESLGDLKIAMRLDGAKVWASIETTTDVAHQLLSGQQESLRGALEAHGLTVERLEVSAPKPETAQDSRQPGVKDHAREHVLQDSAMANQLASSGEDRRSAEGRGGTPQGFVTGRSAGNEEAGGAGEMVLTVRGAPVRMWTEPNGSSTRLRVDAVA